VLVWSIKGQEIVLQVPLQLLLIALILLGALQMLAKWITKEKGSTYLKHIPKPLIKVNLPKVRNPLFIRRPNDGMNVRRTVGVVAREVCVELDSAVFWRLLPASEETAFAQAVLACGVGMPDIDLCVRKRFAGSDIDELHGEAQVDALLTVADIGTIWLTLNPVGPVERLGWILDPAEVEQVLRISGVTGLLFVPGGRPLGYIGFVTLVDVWYCQSK
jgi:hypothetical protein